MKSKRRFMTSWVPGLAAVAIAAPLLGACGGGKPASTPTTAATSTTGATTDNGGHDHDGRHDHDGSEHDVDDQWGVERGLGGLVQP